MADYIIRCRAQVHSQCLDGYPSEAQFGANEPLTEDGTYRKGTIVCDPCYVKLLPYTPSGRGLTNELDAAITIVRKGL